MAKSKNRSSRAKRKEESRNKKSRQLKVAPPCAARDNVLATPELLEIIFAFTEVRNLLVSGQSVCKLWRDVIAQSPRLQKHLFFQPEGERALGDGERRADIPATPNPLLQHAFKDFFFPGHQERSVRFTLTSLRQLPIADMKNGRMRHSAFIRAGASWRSMLVSQPPPRELVLAADRRDPSRAVIRLRGPVRMGLLYDLACHGALYDYIGVVVAWTPDPRMLVEPTWLTEPRRELDRDRSWFEYRRVPIGPVSPADGGHNVVVVGTFPRILKRQARHPSRIDWAWAKEGIMQRIRDDGTRWMFLSEEYDAEAIERRIQEAENEA
ncbi:hypothetical protein PG991_010639 [Apiospora marii]|uniref:F-box domain-containing protein n=1 Tax=Apiospora marii TaxID=335849 RepID=A0ABR1RCY4_9PEZI